MVAQGDHIEGATNNLEGSDSLVLRSQTVLLEDSADGGANVNLSPNIQAN